MLFKSDDPPYFPIGTVVSARYRGAYCSAIVKRVLRLLKVRVTFQMPELGSCVLNENCIKGEVAPGNEVDAKHPERGSFFKAAVTQIMDKSVYTVVYDDGDMSSMRRSKLRAPGVRRFREFESLDLFPLLNPEQFGHPVSVSDMNRQAEMVQEDPNGASSSNPSSPSLDEPNIAEVASTSSSAKRSYASKKYKKSNVQKLGVKFGRPVKRTKKRKSKNSRRKNGRVYVKKEQKSAEAMAAVAIKTELEEKDGIVAQVSSNIQRDRIYYYYFIPEENKMADRKKVYLQKRKAFCPKKIIKLMFPSSETKQETAKPEAIEFNGEPSTLSAISQDNSKQDKEPQPTGSVNEATIDGNIFTKEDNFAIKTEDMFDEVSVADYSQMQFQPEEQLENVPEVHEQPSEPVGNMMRELSEIVERKQVTIPKCPPTGRNHNFVPTLDNVEDSSERAMMIQKSIVAVVAEYFSTRDKLHVLNSTPSPKKK